MARTATKTETKQENPPAEDPTGAVAMTNEQLPAVADDLDFAADGQSTAQMFTQADLKLPFIRLLQDLSPEVDKKKPDYIQGAESGMWMNSLTKKLYDGENGILFIPFAYIRDITEWKPNRGGLVKSHGTDESLFAKTQRNDKGEDVLPNGHTLLLSLMYYGLVIDTDEQVTEPAVIALSKTAAKHGRAWNTAMNTARHKLPNGQVITPATFFYVYQLKAAVESKDQNSWYVPHITRAFETVKIGEHYALINGPELYKQCRDLFKSWKEGRVSAADPGSLQGDGTDNIPF